MAIGNNRANHKHTEEIGLKSARETLEIVVVGGIIVVAGVLSGCSRTMNSAMTISCERLNIVDKKGNTVVRLGVGENRGGEIVVRDNIGNRVVYIYTVEHRGSIHVLGMDGTEAGGDVMISVHEEGGWVSVGGKGGLALINVVDKHGGQVAVSGNDGNHTSLTGRSVNVIGKDGRTVLGVGEHGGRVDVIGKDRKSAASFRVGEYGGDVSAYGKDGNPRAGLGVHESGGYVTVFGNTFGKGGKHQATLGIDGNGGWVAASGKDGKSRAALSINERGGWITAYGKNGSYTSLTSASVSAVGKDGEVKAALKAYQRGGYVGVYGKDGNLKARLGVIGGNGVITTYGKDIHTRTTQLGADFYGGLVRAYSRDQKGRLQLGFDRNRGEVSSWIYQGKEGVRSRWEKVSP